MMRQNSALYSKGVLDLLVDLSILRILKTAYSRSSQV